MGHEEDNEEEADENESGEVEVDPMSRCSRPSLLRSLWVFGLGSPHQGVEVVVTGALSLNVWSKSTFGASLALSRQKVPGVGVVVDIGG